MGLAEAQQKAVDLIDDALAQLDDLPFNTQALAALASFVVQRSH